MMRNFGFVLCGVLLGLCLLLPAWAEAADWIVDKPVEWSAEREALTKAYAREHYGEEMVQIVPRAVVVHWTAGPTWQSAYYHFYHAANAHGTLNYASQFIVDRDGIVYRILPETTMGRHAIGYNWCAIGIENVGGVGGREDLTEAQVAANVRLIRELHRRYPTLKYVFGHYQQVAARASGLYREQVAGYHSVKSDPGPQFMRALCTQLAGDGLQFFPE
ncbi:MAG: peptidoglycan recognition family protein [Selenomonadaceae bacterium]|nr:peptidoglycan recognition family protein [Selenomonadaceae bacterium]